MRIYLHQNAFVIQEAQVAGSYNNQIPARGRGEERGEREEGEQGGGSMDFLHVDLTFRIHKFDSIN